MKEVFRNTAMNQEALLLGIVSRRMLNDDPCVFESVKVAMLEDSRTRTDLKLP